MKKNDDLKIIYKEVDELIPYVNNPRNNTNAVDAVASSIKNFGFKNPIVIDDGNEIINGHTRMLAAKKLGLTKVPCILADDLSDEEIKAFRLADNKTSELAEWDFDLLNSELEEITEMDLDFDMSDFGFEELEKLEDIEAVEDDYSLDEEIIYKTKAGDVWLLGNHRLMCGDSTKQNDVDKLMNGIKADLLLTDPPYNINYQGCTSDKLTIKNDSMEDEEFRRFLVDTFMCANNVMNPGASFYIWHGESESYNFRGAAKDIGWQIRQCLIWNKNQMIIGRQDYQWKHEPCLYGWTEGGEPFLV